MEYLIRLCLDSFMVFNSIVFHVSITENSFPCFWETFLCKFSFLAISDLEVSVHASLTIQKKEQFRTDRDI